MEHRSSDMEDQDGLFEPKTNAFDGSVNAVSDSASSNRDHAEFAEDDFGEAFKHKKDDEASDAEGEYEAEFAEDLDGEYEAEFASDYEADVDPDDAFLPAPGFLASPVVEDAHEEYAAEVAPAPRQLLNPEEDRPNESRITSDDTASSTGAGVGWTAFIFAIASLFLWPQLLGPAAAILGAVAWSRGSRSLGVWSIVIGLISLVAYFILVPLYA